MHIQQKYKIIDNKIDRMPQGILDLGGVFERSTLARDIIFTPDTRCYITQFADRFSLAPRAKGLFFRLREENDLTAGVGKQSLSLQAYRISDEQVMALDHVTIALDPQGHRLADVLKLMELLGVDKVVEVTKKRDEYELIFEENAFGVYIDQVEDLDPGFVEIHATVDKDEEQDMVERLGRLRQKLDLLEKDITVVPYFQQLLRQ